jgi:hypothetical protein
MDDKIEEIARTFPEINIHQYMQQLDENFEEVVFEPLQDFWEDEINRIFDRFEDEDTT